MQDANVHQFSYEICKCHHEKYDGRGCSRRLKGDEIPIASQIVSLAEVFDVLMSSRIYKKAFSCDQAFTMIVKGECSAFSQIMMQCLMKCLGELKKIKAEYEDKNKQP